MVSAIVFVFVWTTLIFSPIAYWTWSYNGWCRNMSCISSTEPCGVGMIDFAGGGPVHMTSGAATLAINMFLRPKTFVVPPKLNFQALHLMSIVIGTALVFFGWFAFNAGSAYEASPLAAHAGNHLLNKYAVFIYKFDFFIEQDCIIKHI